MPKKEKERLDRLALRYGLSLPEFSRRILEEIVSDIPEESFEDYKDSKELKESFKRALYDFRAGRIHVRL